MSQERYDIVIKVLDGPMAGTGDLTLRGPVVRLGADPGPGGLKLTGYRGLDARHAVITAYDGGSVTIAPVGSNQVRVAPHPNVTWKDIDPLRGPEYLNEGGAIHVGPLGRGATLEFVKAQKLGAWTQGAMGSAASNVQSAQVSSAPPPAIQAGAVKNVRTSRVPIWFFGCLFMMATGAITTMVVVLVILLRPKVTPLGPTIEGLPEGSEYINMDEIDPEQLAQYSGGFEQAFEAFVMTPNIDAAPDRKKQLSKKENWDQEFFKRTVASAMADAQNLGFYRRLEAITDAYAGVTEILQDAGLPEVFAAIPYRESVYKPDLVSDVCARGYWQFMPEVAHRLAVKNNVKGLDVQRCGFKSRPGVLWSPQDEKESEFTPPKGVLDNAAYVDHANKKCDIQKCEQDGRGNLEASTQGAAVSLGEPMQDEDLRASGAVVQIAIASHNAGYADGRFGVAKSSNLKPAFKKWSGEHPESEHPTFYGSNIKCNTGDHLGVGFCGAPFPEQTQHYVYPIVGKHLLAVCYYAKNHSDKKPFKSWKRYLESGSYCDGTYFTVPSSGDLR